jgi:hypothetical protein
VYEYGLPAIMHWNGSVPRYKHRYTIGESRSTLSQYTPPHLGSIQSLIHRRGVGGDVVGNSGERGRQARNIKTREPVRRLRRAPWLVRYPSLPAVTQKNSVLNHANFLRAARREAACG